MDPLVTPHPAAETAADAVRKAHGILLPIMRDLPGAESYLFTDDSARNALKILAELDPGLLTTYIDNAVRPRCGPLVARLVTEMAGGRLPERNQQALRALNAGDLVNHHLPELQPILLPWLFEKNLCMVHAKRGVGKTHMALAVAFAVASGGTFLSYRAPKPRGVLYLDGEMPAQLMQQRLRELMGTQGESPDLLRIVTPDMQDRSMPDLGTVAGQREIDSLVDGDTALIVVDNLSCLVRSGGAENESESWSAISEWGLSHRRAGRAVLFIHHSGKSGAQRGTSKREDLLDVVIALKHPSDYGEQDGAVFDINFEKARSLRGDSVAPIEARLVTLPNGQQEWTWRAVEDVTRKTVAGLWNGGALTLMDVSRELGMNKSSVHRQLAALMTEGALTRPYPQTKKGRS